jgi:hypothetical protein
MEVSRMIQGVKNRKELRSQTPSLCFTLPGSGKFLVESEKFPAEIYRELFASLLKTNLNLDEFSTLRQTTTLNPCAQGNPPL